MAVRGDLIPVAQAVQAIYGFVPRNALLHVARRLGIPASKAYGVVSFYSGFHLHPRGRRVLQICTGTACHQRGAKRVLERLADALALPPEGGTTTDLSHTLEEVACVGCCSLAPAVRVDANIHARIEHHQATRLLEAP